MTTTRNESHDWEAWLLRARLEAESGHTTAAVAAYEVARRLDPRSALFSS